MDGAACKVTDLHDARVSLRVPFLTFTRLCLRLCESNVFSSLFASRFAHLLDCIYNVFDSIKRIQWQISFFEKYKPRRTSSLLLKVKGFSIFDLHSQKLHNNITIS